MKNWIRDFIWTGPIIVGVGLLSYFLFFAKFPALRDFPWVNLPLVTAGLAISLWSIGSAWSRSDLRHRILHITGLAVSLILAGFFYFYVFVLSFQMPEARAETLAFEVAPAFELPGASGNTVRLEDFRGKRLVISFYRGYW